MHYKDLMFMIYGPKPVPPPIEVVDKRKTLREMFMAQRMDIPRRKKVRK